MVGLDVGFIPPFPPYQCLQLPACAAACAGCGGAWQSQEYDASMEYGMGQNLGVPWWISKYIEIADEWLFIPQKNIVSYRFQSIAKYTNRINSVEVITGPQLCSFTWTHLSSAAKFSSPQTPLAWTSRDSPFDAMDKNLTKDATGSMLVMSLRLRRIPGKHPIVGWNPQCRGMDVHPVKYGDKTLLTHPIQWNLSSLLIPSLCSPCNASMVAPLFAKFSSFFHGEIPIVQG